MTTMMILFFLPWIGSGFWSGLHCHGRDLECKKRGKNDEKKKKRVESSGKKNKIKEKTRRKRCLSVVVVATVAAVWPFFLSFQRGMNWRKKRKRPGDEMAKIFWREK